MAQLVARLVRIEEVRGSNPLSSTNSVLLKLTDQVGAERPRLRCLLPAVTAGCAHYAAGRERGPSRTIVSVDRVGSAFLVERGEGRLGYLGGEQEVAVGGIGEGGR